MGFEIPTYPNEEDENGAQLPDIEKVQLRAEVVRLRAQIAELEKQVCSHDDYINAVT